MYHHHILRRPTNELISKFYHAQKLKPSKGDFVSLIENDKKMIGISLSNEEISKLSKYKYKKLVKKAILDEAFKDLIRKKENSILSDDEKCLLLKCRVRELDVKLNYRNGYQNQNLQCSLCLSGEDDSQYHLFHCWRLIDHCDNLANNVTIEYEDLFSDMSLQIPAAKLLSEIWKVRMNILEDG